jgi:hypothetical protein
MERCVNWMKATVPAGFILSPVDFCSGHKNPGLDGWYSIVRCGPDPELLDGTAPKYCTSSGQIGKSEAWAAGFRSGSSDGHELLDGGAGNPQNIAVTFYSRTPVWMGSLRLPAGMYDLKPAKSSDGWSLTVAKQDGADLGKLEMKVVDPNNHDAGKGLAISTRPWADKCPGPALDQSVRELHFIYRSTDIFVCLRPDQILASPEEDVSQR